MPLYTTVCGWGVSRQSFAVLLILFGFVQGLADETQTAIDFGRDIRPILAKHCFTCHGPDENARESGLRLDQRDAAIEDLGGYHAIKPGVADESELILRVTSEDEDLRMPPPESNLTLSDAQIRTFRNWINDGAEYQTHWSFLPPERPAVPSVNNPQWCSNPIDRFVLAKMESAGLSPSSHAKKSALVRRAYLDLTGVTPSTAEVDRFVNDSSTNAYQKLLDRLLASNDYAERFARPWLDLARYADTNGYEKDRERTMWPYRDWVIGAIADDKPYDEFSIEQLAGDMLDSPTNAQRIATGFHRNTMINEEGGIDPLEYRFYAMVDRVATTGTVWMGLTTGCAQCHTHKYDPITHTDYYAMFALLNNADEPDVVVEDPAIQQERDRIQRAIDREFQRIIDSEFPEFEKWKTGKIDKEAVASAFILWLDKQFASAQDWVTIVPSSTETTMPKLSVLDDDSILASGDVTKRDVYKLTFQIPERLSDATALRLESLPHHSLPGGGPGLAFYEGRRGDFFLSEMTLVVDDQPVKLVHPSHDYGNISVGSGNANANNVIDREGSTGWSTSGREGKASHLVVNFQDPLKGGKELEIEMLFERHFAAALGRFRLSLVSSKRKSVASGVNRELVAAFARGAKSFSAKEYRTAAKHFVKTSKETQVLRKRIDQLEKTMPQPVRTLAMQQRHPDDYRTTQRHHRGEYLKREETVQPNLPQVFGRFEHGRKADRLEFARWLISDQNPLVARVTVNRAWRQFFGTGIVRTAGDFGTQSESPSHPKLIDWLACEFQEQGWSLKHLHRMIVSTSTYRQSVGSLSAMDPDNRLLSVFPHRRLEAEQIRDTLLSASGLLTRQVGGPSVYPPQPTDVTALAYGKTSWVPSNGGDRFRRSLYTFSKRTAPFAAFNTFDGPTGELCIARRDVSTTPLQALTLLNDAMFIEMARALAKNATRTVDDRSNALEIASEIFRRLFVREPTEREIEAILQFYRHEQDHAEPWMLVARALMNTDEAITVP